MSESETRAAHFIAERRRSVGERLDAIEAQLVGIRSARGEWTDEEHDPEGFTLVSAWSQGEGARQEHRQELRELDDAELRLAAGTYGICDRCGLPIPDGQLSRRPARTRCVACTDGRAR